MSLGYYKLGKPTATSVEKDGSDAAPGRYVVQRKETGHFLDGSHRPTKDLEAADTFASSPMAKLWADKANAALEGNWEAIPHPEGLEPDDDHDEDPSAVYSRLGKRAA